MFSPKSSQTSIDRPFDLIPFYRDERANSTISPNTKFVIYQINVL